MSPNVISLIVFTSLFASAILAMRLRMLLPHPHLKMERSVSLKGEIPSPINLPKGCFLASRCPFAVDRCSQSIPPAEEIRPGHFVHCFRHEEVSRLVPASETFNEFMVQAEKILGRRVMGTGSYT